MNVPFVDLSAQYRTIAGEIQEAVLTVLTRGDFVLGQDVGLFEQEFAAYCEVGYAVGVDSGTSALELALRAFDIGAGDEVITAANTFIATVFAISYTGARPVLVDADPQTYTIDPSGIESAISEKTRAIVPVHLYGQPADMDPILEIARRHHLAVIEDACQAHGARYRGRSAGSIGDAAAFSFYPSKNLGAYGDAGIVVTNDERIARAVRMLRNYGQQTKYQHTMRGYNHRLDTLQAAVLRVKLPHLDAWKEARRQHAELYNRLLAPASVSTPQEADYAESVYHLYVIQVDKEEREGASALLRDELMTHLRARGIATGIHYPIPVHLQEACRDLGYEHGSFPVTEHAAKRILSLPMYAELTPSMITYVADAVREF
jgi:dTDP-4-amino-4,6-dideoxygalactose transaminase